jgi:hypothetical protein
LFLDVPIECRTFSSFLHQQHLSPLESWDLQGQLQETTSGADCASDFAPGDTVTLWYLPALPGTAIPGKAKGMVFFVSSVVYLGSVVFCLVFLLRKARGRSSRHVCGRKQLVACGREGWRAH